MIAFIKKRNFLVVIDGYGGDLLSGEEASGVEQLPELRLT